MIASLLGLEVTRQIPAEVVTGLLTGRYSLHGSVIRWAAGTDHAGQIVRHLLPVAKNVLSDGLSLFSPVSAVFGAVNTYQLGRIIGKVDQLQVITQQILQVATGTMLLSGLNLTVSAVGFAVIGRRLSQLQSKLNELQKDVKAIRYLLDLEERTRLEAAIKDLRYGIETVDPANRHALLFNARNVLGPINLKYRTLLADHNKTLEEAMVCEEYYFLTSLAHARCVAELGMLDVAASEMEETKAFWQVEARHIVNQHLLGQYPERFLSSDFSESVPTMTLVGWLDFAYADERGYEWIDELRSKTSPWYAKGWRDTLPKRLASSQMTRETERIMPSLQKLVAKSYVLEGYIGQYELLKKCDVTPSSFNHQLIEVARSAGVDDYVILSNNDVP